MVLVNRYFPSYYYDYSRCWNYLSEWGQIKSSLPNVIFRPGDKCLLLPRIQTYGVLISSVVVFSDRAFGALLVPIKSWWCGPNNWINTLRRRQRLNSLFLHEQAQRRSPMKTCWEGTVYKPGKGPFTRNQTYSSLPFDFWVIKIVKSVVFFVCLFALNTVSNL